MIYNKQYNKDSSCNTVQSYAPNRWYNLYKNPLDNSIENFNRIGEDTVLNLLNSIETDDDEISKSVRGETSRKSSMGLIDGITPVTGNISNSVLRSGINKRVCDEQNKLDSWLNPWLPLLNEQFTVGSHLRHSRAECNPNYFKDEDLCDYNDGNFTLINNDAKMIDSAIANR